MFLRDLRLSVACEARTHLSVPLVGSRVAAGFPSPADDYLEHPLDFNDLLIANPAATFAVRVAGDSMIGARIFPGVSGVLDLGLMLHSSGGYDEPEILRSSSR